jgi:hypothetical protein
MDARTTRLDGEPPRGKPFHRALHGQDNRGQCRKREP